MVNRKTSVSAQPRPSSNVAHARVHAGGEQGVARGGTQPLAQSVGEAQHQQSLPTCGEGDQRSGEAGQRIADHHPGLGPTGPVHDHPGAKLQEAGGGLGDVLDQPQGARPGHERRGEIQRHQRVDHLAGRVVEQADQADQPDGAGQGEDSSDHGDPRSMQRQSGQTPSPPEHGPRQPMIRARGCRWRKYLKPHTWLSAAGGHRRAR